MRSREVMTFRSVPKIQQTDPMLRDLQVTGTPGWFACQAANGNDA